MGGHLQNPDWINRQGGREAWVPATGRTELRSPQAVLDHEDDASTALCNDVTMSWCMQSAPRACCSMDLNPHLQPLPQIPISIPKPFIFKPLLGTGGCQHSMISPTVMTLKRNLSSLTQLREYPEHGKKKLNDLPTLHWAVTVRTKNMTSDFVHPSSLLLSWGLHRFKGNWESCFKEHETQSTI